jgi:inward rectifier potassium channel
VKPERKPRRYVPRGASYGFQVLGEKAAPLHDFYHALLRNSWGVTFSVIAGVFLAANALFAAVYLLVGGIAHAEPGSFLDAFFFSVQTMGTIGYGALAPETPGANAVVVVESITGLTLTALATGLVFAKVSRSTARVVYSREAVVCLRNGVPTLMVRMSNQRGNQIVGAQIRVAMVRPETTSEGETFFRTLDLKLHRDHLLSLSRSWTALHTIDETSPLYSETPDSIAAKEIELQALVIGIDDISMQTVHASHRYFSHQLLWGRRHVDIVSEAENGDVVLDLRKFHDTEPTRPTDAFPYPGPT